MHERDAGFASQDPFFADFDRIHRAFFQRSDELFGSLFATMLGHPPRPGQEDRVQADPRRPRTEGVSGFGLAPFRGFEAALRGFEDLDPAELGGPAPQGSYFSQTFVSAQRLGPDGRVQREDYFKNDINGVAESGERIGQSEEMYRNTGTGVKKLAQQRVLGEQGYKRVKSRVGEGTLRSPSARRSLRVPPRIRSRPARTLRTKVDRTGAQR